MKDICGLTYDELTQILGPLGYSSNHALAVSNSVYKKKITDFSLISKIPRNLQSKLAEIARIGITYPLRSCVSNDQSIKYLFRTESGEDIESVYIPDKKRHTVCVSTQAGCKMGCSFCATGRYGFRGNLSAGEIVNQVISIPDSEKITHVVFMGMGEPMDNLENVLKACEILTAQWGVAISPRNITISTVGITPGIEQFLERSECNLTVSLYSPFSDQRSEAIPVERIYPVKDIIQLLRRFPAGKRRRISLAYIMISNVNDSEEHLEELIHLLKGSTIRVNILPYHSVDFQEHETFSSDGSRMNYFKHRLVTSRISASVRKSRGEDISAACGLLAGGMK